MSAISASRSMKGLPYVDRANQVDIARTALQNLYNDSRNGENGFAETVYCVCAPARCVRVYAQPSKLFLERAAGRITCILHLAGAHKLKNGKPEIAMLRWSASGPGFHICGFAVDERCRRPGHVVH
jgi:hypothetical protein